MFTVVLVAGYVFEGHIFGSLNGEFNWRDFLIRMGGASRFKDILGCFLWICRGR